MAIKLAVDSAADINMQEALALGVHMIPLTILFESESYTDGVDLTHREFFEKLTQCEKLPKTSQINPFQFEEFFRELTADGSEVIMITLSSKLSGTYANALQAADGFPGHVFVVDSENASIGERLLLLHALRLINEPIDAQTLFDRLENDKKRIRLMALLGTLDYLQKGGRISTLTAVSGTLLHIRPVIAIEGGTVRVLGKAMGSKKGNHLLSQLIRDVGVDYSMPYGAAYSDPDDSLLQTYLRDSSSLWKEYTEAIPAYPIGSAIGTHIGPGAIGVSFFAIHE